MSPTEILLEWTVPFAKNATDYRLAYDIQSMECRSSFEWTDDAANLLPDVTDGQDVLRRRSLPDELHRDWQSYVAAKTYFFIVRAENDDGDSGNGVWSSGSLSVPSNRCCCHHRKVHSPITTPTGVPGRPGPAAVAVADSIQTPTKLDQSASL